MSGASPGPWRWSHGWIEAGDKMVCEMASAEGQEQEAANARLIAAAPEMLDVIRRWAQETCWSRQYDGNPTCAEGRGACGPCQSRALIARLEPHHPGDGRG